MLCRRILTNIHSSARFRPLKQGQRTLATVTQSAPTKPTKPKFPVLDGSVDTTSTEFIKNKDASEIHRERYVGALRLAQAGGGQKAIDRHVNRNKKMLATDRLKSVLDEGGDWVELGSLAGLGMEYGDVPRAGILAGVGQVNGIQCLFIVNDATVKGGTVYPISVKKQLRAQEVAIQNNLPCIYIVDSGGAFLPLQADIFPDKEQGGRAFYNEAILNSMGIPQLAIVCGSCTAGGAYVPTMCQEAVIVDRVGTIFLGGPPLVYAALGEVVSSEDLGGATLHSSVSGCTDHFAKDEKEAFVTGRTLVDTFGMDPMEYTTDYEEPLFDVGDMSGLIPHTDQHTMDITKVLARIVDGSRVQEFKARWGTTLFTGFASIEGHRVGILGSNGPMTADAASKGAHFVQLCDQRRIPIAFLQNTSPAAVKDASTWAIELRMHARLMSTVACSTVPKLTMIIGNSFGAENYLMGGRSFDPRFVFSWPNARIGAEDPTSLTEKAIQAKYPDGAVPGDEESEKAVLKLKTRVETQTSALYASSRVWDDGVILPEDTRKVLGNLMRIVNQSRPAWVNKTIPSRVIRL